ncbi:S9 family peptidase [Dinghuibacter silviterrae]|uniref:Dipeptidyl-peptidase-4 n=1 Tax=Dinghuibacter silviterrae TaxID=1539049 RepID=A0A4R8DHL5_9BACT|nr:S9 family peptidase [Dinghuibacter silviterrae]TDW96440.1 dipeptidyl-peptidase-4 [Dinghuibacter silviterrae]
MRRIAALVFVLPLFVQAQDKKEYTDLKDALFTAYRFGESPGPSQVTWIEGGNRLSYKTESEGILTLDPATGEEHPVLKGKNLRFPGSGKVFSYESFQWAADGKHLVFTSNPRQIFRRSTVSDFYVYDLGAGELRLAAKDARSAGLSPDGSMVGIVREGNMYVDDLGAGKEAQLTHDDGVGEFNGFYDWVYEEEFGKAQAWNWSPDSRYIAYWHFDERKVPVFQMTNFEGTHPEYEQIPIPDPGDPNPSVRIGVVDVHTHKNVWLEPEEKGDFYIPRMYWTSDPDVVALVTLNRAQNHLKLYFFNVRTGARRVVLEEKNQTWISIFNFYTGVDDMFYFPEKTKEFFWVSDRSGYSHIYRYGYDGKTLGTVTSGNWDVLKVTGIDPATETLYYLSGEAGPLEQQLYRIHFDGTGKQRLSQEAGYHDIDMGPNARFYLDTYSNSGTPTQVALRDRDGKTLKILADGSAGAAFLEQYAYAPTEYFKVTATDGTTLDASMIKPFHFDSSKRYPVVFDVYGGPESHNVYNRFAIDGWRQWLAQNGYIVVDVNNRGSAGYGSAFLKIVYKQLGRWESNDFAETARFLSNLPFVDSTRMAIMGTSYGGYSTVYTLLTHPGVFKAGIANSPVTDWRLYDDIYTERYMGLPAGNEDGYRKSACETYAANLQGHLLLIHSMSDDNVHPAHTMQLLTALTNAGRDADLRIYPPGGHGAVYNLESYLLIAGVGYHYLEQYLK